MRIYLDGWGFSIQELTREDVKSLLRMIKGAKLCERRDFDDLKSQIEELEKGGLMDK